MTTTPPAGGRKAQLERTGLRPGWTTGACATAATSAAYTALLTGEFPDPVVVTLPRGQQPAFALAAEDRGDGWAMAAVVKDAGDDPDVTHLAVIRSTVRHGVTGAGVVPRAAPPLALIPSTCHPGVPGAGVVFRAGPGVGTVTLPGLPLDVGEPAINPVPRRMMREAVAALAARHRASGDVVVELGVEGGAELARKTWNPR